MNGLLALEMPHPQKNLCDNVLLFKTVSAEDTIPFSLKFVPVWYIGLPLDYNRNWVVTKIDKSTIVLMTLTIPNS